MLADFLALLLAALPAVSGLATARDVRLLPAAGARAGRPVLLRGTVTFAPPRGGYFYLQDATGGVRVKWAADRDLRAGERVAVRGRTTAGAFLPEVEARAVTADGPPGGPPRPAEFTLALDDAPYLDGQLVEVVAVVERAWAHEGWLQFDLARGRGNAVAYVPLPLPARAGQAQSLAGAVARVRGVCRVNANAARQLAGPPRILVNDLNDFAVLRPARADPFGAPPRTAAELVPFRADPVEARLPARVEGVVTLNQGGKQVYVHDGTGAVQATLTDSAAILVGDRVAVVGYPRPGTDPARLDNARLRALGPGRLPPPRPGTPAQARDGKLEGEVVRLTGTVHEVGRQKDWMTLTVLADGLTFTTILRDLPAPRGEYPAWPPGSGVEVTGVVTRQPLEGVRRTAFVVVAGAADIKVLEAPPLPRPPSWWADRRLAYLAAGFLGLALAGGATVTALRAQVRRATALVRRQYEEKEKLEGQLKLAAKLEAVGRLAGGIAHDFNNLLTVINGCAEMLAEEVAGGPGGAPGHAAEIQRAGRQAAALTRQLLTFSRQRAVTPHPLDLSAAVAEAALVLARLVGERVKVLVSTGPGLPPVMAESSLLAQILLNLAVNARDAMPDGGTLALATALAEPGWVRLSASDTGCGMSEEVKAHVFEPFFTTKEVGKGTGLGLSTVYGIVQTLGGRIRFRSELGRGTTFEVDLPAAGSPAAAAPPAPLAPLRLPPPLPDAATELAGAAEAAVALPPAPKPPAAGSGVVFLVEDDDAVRAIVHHVLVSSGLAVLSAAGPEEAMAALSGYAGPLDLLITDVVMPGRSGRELAEQFREARPGLRVLFISGYTSDEILLQGVREEQVDFLHKPFSSRELVEQVRRLLGQPVA
jgi:signal transduction histidine kinase/CheY-like chemotaxis protein